MIIAVDFDGTIVAHDYPRIGEPIPFAFAIMKKFQKEGHRLILLTMRCGKDLDEAVAFCQQHGLSFWAVNSNPDQDAWTTSRKVYADMYIDDLSIGIPMRNGMVDWLQVYACYQKIDWNNPKHTILALSGGNA